MIEKPKTVNDYYLIINNAREKIAELQAKCEHKEFQAELFSARPGSFVPYIICKLCRALISEASEEESKALLEKTFQGIV